jgi:hypothetical protein
MQVENHDFCKKEIGIFYAQPLYMHYAVECTGEFGSSAQRCLRAQPRASAVIRMQCHN